MQRCRRKTCGFQAANVRVSTEIGDNWGLTSKTWGWTTKDGYSAKICRVSPANMVSKNKGNWEQSRFHAQFGGEKKPKIAPFQETQPWMRRQSPSSMAWTAIWSASRIGWSDRVLSQKLRFYPEMWGFRAVQPSTITEDTPANSTQICVIILKKRPNTCS